MTNKKRLFLIPVGLPGLGKTTLARQLERHLALNQKREFLRISYDELLLKRQ
jgi:MoxR-like ATPase